MYVYKHWASKIGFSDFIKPDKNRFRFNQKPGLDLIENRFYDFKNKPVFLENRFFSFPKTSFIKIRLLTACNPVFNTN